MPDADLIERLRKNAADCDAYAITHLFPAGLAVVAKLENESAARIAELVEQVQKYKREMKARSMIDPVTRLHNLCDMLAEDRDKSPYDQASWDLQDAVYQEKCIALNAAESLAAQQAERIAELEAGLRDDHEFLYNEWNRLCGIDDEVAWAHQRRAAAINKLLELP